MKKHLPLRSLSVIFIFLFAVTACKKDSPTTIPDNDAPYYGGIPKVTLQNYINRLFIDLIGREPLDTEMAAEESFLRASDISIASREQLITKLQTNTAHIPGDSSYKHAYYNRFYELCKARVLEAASNDHILSEAGIAYYGVIQDSLAGDSLGVALGKANVLRLLEVVDCEEDYRMDSIEIKDVFARMLDNSVYDQINMNTFNFLNATFNDLFLRFPTTNEFNAGFAMVEFNNGAVLFGKAGQNKGDYLNILTSSDEFYEGIINWMYKTLLAREPSSGEVYATMNTFFNDHDLQKVQRNILKTDEYANFKK